MSTERQVARLLRKRAVRRNVARAAAAEYQREDHTKPPGMGSLAASLVVTAQLHATPVYRRAVRQAKRRDLLALLHLRKHARGRPVEEILARFEHGRGGAA